jgi:hypothetical protein
MGPKGVGSEGAMWIHLVRNKILRRRNFPLYDCGWLLRTSVIHISRRNTKHELQDGTPGDCFFKCHHVESNKLRNIGIELEISSVLKPSRN